MTVVLVKDWTYNEVTTFIHMVANAISRSTCYTPNDSLVDIACKLSILISEAPEVPKKSIFNGRLVKKSIIARDHYIKSNIGSVFALAKYPNLAFDFNECVL